MGAKIDAYVLPAEETPYLAPQLFAGCPGVWTPDVPVAVATLAEKTGLTAREVADRVTTSGAPLRKVKIDPPADPEPDTEPDAPEED